MSDLHKKAGVGGTSAQSQEQKAQSLQEFSHMILNVGNNTRDQITRTAWVRTLTLTSTSWLGDPGQISQFLEAPMSSATNFGYLDIFGEVEKGYLR